jgi:uncharacterized NAD-dependent epimerase/dehydratase family protein
VSAGSEGNAVVYCEGAFNTTSGKTAHGLVRRSERYRMLSVVDSRYGGRDAGEVLDGRPAGILVHAGIEEAVRASREAGTPATHLVMGLAPDGGRLPAEAREHLRTALGLSLHLVSGLHDFLGDDPDLAAAARAAGLGIVDVRRPKERAELHFFSGTIEQVEALRVAVLGTDSAVGKRTTAWLLVDGLRAAGRRAGLVGTGQTAWLQGARHTALIDTTVNDFVAGEIEHAVVSAWEDGRPDALVIEGQGSLLNPAYPGGFEILAAARPHCVVLQHAPARRDYDGFPGYPIQPLPRQIEAIELISSRRVVGIAVNSEDLSPERAAAAREQITLLTGLPAVDPLTDGVGPLVEALLGWFARDPGRAGRS